MLFVSQACFQWQTCRVIYQSPMIFNGRDCNIINAPAYFGSAHSWSSRSGASKSVSCVVSSAVESDSVPSVIPPKRRKARATKLNPLDTKREEVTKKKSIAQEKVVTAPKAEDFSDDFVIEKAANMFRDNSEKPRGTEGSDVLTLDPDELIPGDLVVHQKYGTAKFMKQKTETPPGKAHQVTYLYLEFGDGIAKVSLKEARKVLYRFGMEGATSRLSRLKDITMWEKKKKKTELSIRKLVNDMIELRVKRLRLNRPLYNKNAADEAQFNSGFPFIPTIDQQKAVQDVESDMMTSESPMDRLVCGDVGFGKTEVAMRAIFLAVQSGKQVLLLTPTTVLARQHFLSVKKRFEEFAHVRVGYVSRLLKPNQRVQVQEAISRGEIDIAVGTHSLLSSNVNYSHVGLLIIDEEQKFGVRHKDKITSMKSTIDVLTLTATPIPRTLYMTVNGFRDVSIINTPPPERVPIKSIVTPFNIDIVRKAVTFELERGGQVFYVVPRVTGIDEKAARICEMFPDAVVDIAHGQLHPEVLDLAMERFQDNITQILLCTTIIESGLDVSSCNTIVVEDVQRFGLSQLYQLRGRVGRSDRQAFAYLFHPKLEYLTAEAKLRLEAMVEFSQLGQGFSIAERDMQIRGVGSIFGEEQSGNMSLVGRDLYLQMVQDTIKLIREKSSLKISIDDVKLEIGLDTRIPVEYIPVTEVREKYHSLMEEAAMVSVDAVLDVVRNMQRTCGPSMPLSVTVLVKMLCVKQAASRFGITQIYTQQNKDVIMVTCMSPRLFLATKKLMADQEMAEELSFINGRIRLKGVINMPSSLILERLLICLLDMNNIPMPKFD